MRFSLFFLAAGFACAQCQSPADLAEALAISSSPVQPFAARIGALEKLLEKRPLDPFVNRAYIALLSGYAKRPLFDRVILPHYTAAPPHLRALAASKRDRAGSVASVEAFIRE